MGAAGMGLSVCMERERENLSSGNIYVKQKDGVWSAGSRNGWSGDGRSGKRESGVSGDLSRGRKKKERRER